MGQNNPETKRRVTPAKKTRLSWKIRLFVVWPFYGVLLAAVGMGAAFIHYTLVFPNPLELRVKPRAPLIRILARDGSLLAERGKAHDFMPLDLIPRHVINAVIATEDRRFYSHWGIDPLGLIRAGFANLRAGHYVQGGSTLTQQLAKNLFLTSRRTLSRKFEEILLALWLEIRLSKRDILELYLNRVYFGGGAYGIEAAAQLYFDKSVRALNLNEAAMIAGLLKAPSRYSPRANPGLARARARTVLRRIRDAGFITQGQYRRASRRSMHFARRKSGRRSRAAGYAVDFVLERLPEIVGTESRELIVETTIDAPLQRQAQRTVVRMLHKAGRAAKVSQAAVVVLDGNGGIRALIGGRSHKRSQYNRATKAKRQPGSAFKTFVYLAALEQGMKPDSIAYDLPINIRGWKPRNAGGHYRGAVNLRTALTHSINTVAVRLNMSVGSKKVIRLARRLGIHSPLRNEPSLALGTSEVTLLELTGAYGVLANGGYKLKPHIIRRIKTHTGRIIFAQGASRNKRIVSAANVGAMNDMLNAVIVAGTGRRAALARHPAAGKTGTTQNYRDAWFIGYTAQLVAGVWVGNDNSRPMHKVAGGGLPARIWHNLMTKAHAGRRVLPLPGTRLLPRRPRYTPAKLPKTRIGEDFSARLTRGVRGVDDANAAPVDIAGLLRRDRTQPLDMTQTRPRDTGQHRSRPKSWWRSSADALYNVFGLSPAARRRDSGHHYMSLGGPAAKP